MTYQANNELTYYVNKKTRGSIYGFASAVILFIIASFAFYYNSPSATMYTINLTVSAIISCSLAYSMTMMEGKKLNKIVNEIIILDGKLTFTTYSYRCLFYIIQPQRYEVSKIDLKMQEVGFPFNSLDLVNNKTYLIIINENNIYICYQCFSDSLLLELRQIGNFKN